ncbi:MAG: diguanylate cyclase [Halanaerobiales bacterium]|nr:diguanylate cyclase [Halanaerobiales bacterium]
MKQLSFHDQLTGLYNRRYFEDTIERLNDSRILPIGVITADIDKFKSINDIYGHRVGDEYIKKTAEILSNNVRNEDIVCRIGGDEFAIILPGIKSEIISNIENRIQNEIKEVEIKDCDFSISTGLEVKTDHKQDLEEIINKSDQKMYSMKELTKETALKKKLSIFKNKEKIVFEEFPMGIVISDLKGNIVEVNKQFCNMLGYSKEELKNMKHLDITKKEDNKINKKIHEKVKK